MGVWQGSFQEYYFAPALPKIIIYLIFYSYTEKNLLKVVLLGINLF
jgi:hypothetical protein